MKTIETIQKTKFTCDRCGAGSDDGKGWFSFEYLEDIGLRLIEQVKKTKAAETRHYTSRKEVDFCSRECVEAYMSESVDSFISELMPPKDRGFNTELF